MTKSGGRVVASHVEIALHPMSARAHTLRARHRSTGRKWSRRERFRGSEDGEEEAQRERHADMKARTPKLSIEPDLNQEPKLSLTLCIIGCHVHSAAAATCLALCIMEPP